MTTEHILATLIGALAAFYGPVLIYACRHSYRAGVKRGKQLGHDEASQLWPQHSDYDDRIENDRRR